MLFCILPPGGLHAACLSDYPLPLSLRRPPFQETPHTDLKPPSINLFWKPQDWLRSTLIHCNAQRYRLRTAGRNFLTYLLRSAFHYYGSIGVIRKPLMAVFQGMIRCCPLDRKPLRPLLPQTRALQATTFSVGVAC